MGVFNTNISAWRFPGLTTQEWHRDTPETWKAKFSHLKMYLLFLFSDDFPASHVSFRGCICRYIYIYIRIFIYIYIIVFRQEICCFNNL